MLDRKSFFLFLGQITVVKKSFPHLMVLALLLSCCSCYRPEHKHTDDKPTPLTNTSENYKKGELLLIANNDSAFYYFNEVTITSKDSLEIAMAFNKMAILQFDGGDYFGSQESLLTSLRYLDESNERNHHCLLSNYNELGSNSLNLKNYTAAIDYYEKAINFTGNQEYKMIALNNKALAYQRKKDYKQALNIYQTLLDRTKKNTPEYARVLSNMAKTKWLQDSNYQAAPEFLTALQIREAEKDLWGINSSYDHLSNFYKKILPDSALFYTQKFYDLAKELGSPDNELDAIARLIELGPIDAEKKYFHRYKLLNDSLRASRDSAKNQFAPIRYNVEKHKSDTLTLQKENAETRLRILWWQVILIIVAILTITGFIWYRKRKQHAIQDQRLRMSKKVHDKVANRVYRIMSEVEHKGIPEKNVLLYKLNIVYKQSRDISYDQPHHYNQDFQQSVAELLQSFANDSVRIASVGNSEALWNKVSTTVKEELSIILEELLTNMKKHSAANNVVVKFMQKDSTIEVYYSDDGIGLSHEVNYGNGLRNTETRIKDISGTIIFDNTKPGLKIRIIIPIDKQI